MRIRLPSTAREARAAAEPAGILYTPWSTVMKNPVSASSRHNRRQFDHLGILTQKIERMKDRKSLNRLEQDGLLAKGSLRQAEVAMDGQPLWNSIFRHLTSANCQHISDLANCRHGQVYGEGQSQQWAAGAYAMWPARRDTKGLPKSARPPQSPVHALQSPKWSEQGGEKPIFTGCKSEAMVIGIESSFVNKLNVTSVPGIPKDAYVFTVSDTHLKAGCGGRVDGTLETAGGDILAAFEAKPTVRELIEEPVVRQEGLLTVLCLIHRPEPYRLGPFMVVAMDADEIFLRFAKPTPGYLNFLNDEHHHLGQLADEDFLNIRTFGPFCIWRAEHLRMATTSVLALLITTHRMALAK